MNRKDVRAAIAQTLNRSERKRVQLVRRDKLLRPSTRDALVKEVLEHAIKREHPQKPVRIEDIEGA